MSDQPIDYDPPFVPRLRNVRNQVIIVDEENAPVQQQQQQQQPTQTTINQFFPVVDRNTAIINVQRALESVNRDRPRAVITTNLSSVTASVPAPLPRSALPVRTGKKGRPKGSGSKKNALIIYNNNNNTTINNSDLPVKRGKGRPKGSLNRPRPNNFNLIGNELNIRPVPIPVNPATGKRPRGRPRNADVLAARLEMERRQEVIDRLQQQGETFLNLEPVNNQVDVQMQEATVYNQLTDQLQVQLLEESNALRILGDDRAADALLVRLLAGEQLTDEEQSIINAALLIGNSLESTLDKLNNNIPLNNVETQIVERLSQGDSPEKVMDDFYFTASQLGLLPEQQQQQQQEEEEEENNDQEQQTSLNNYGELINQVNLAQSQSELVISNNNNNNSVNTNSIINFAFGSNPSSQNNNNNNIEDPFENTPEFIQFLGTGFGSQNNNNPFF